MQCIDHQPMVLGESPLWDHRTGRLYWIDIELKQLHALDIEAQKRFLWTLPSKPGCVALYDEETLLIALSKEIVQFSPLTGQWQALPGTRINGSVRFNDGKRDAMGRFWVGSMDLQEADPVGKLYCLENALENERLVQKEQNIIIANGLGWSPDQQRMYFTDSPRKIIYCYDFDLSQGEISKKRVFAKIPEGVGYPDGLCVDQQGYVWSAHFMGERITRYAPDGSIESVMKVPALCPTSCCIGGKKMNQLFITTATRDLTDHQKKENPLNGCVFKVELLRS